MGNYTHNCYGGHNNVTLSFICIVLYVILLRQLYASVYLQT